MSEKATEVTLKQREKGAEPAVILHEPIPTILIDGFVGAAVVNGTVRVNLFEERYDPVASQLNRHVLMRMAIPIESFDSFADVLYSLKDSLLKIGENGGGDGVKGE